jgi:hypothetical protein
MRTRRAIGCAPRSAKRSSRWGRSRSPRALFRKPGWPGQPDSRSGARRARGALWKRRSMAPENSWAPRDHSPVVPAGSAHVFAPAEAILEPGRDGLLAGCRRRGAGVRTRHVRARVPHGVWCERDRISMPSCGTSTGEPSFIGSMQFERIGLCYWKIRPTRACRRSRWKSSPLGWRRANRSKCSMRDRGITSRARAISWKARLARS